ncbi:DUF3391 domain-containing protein [Rhizobium sp. P40RR-XXII]|uniref:DUF3391 domain-containing protein n=1 Tax=Rhizobium sp. P40RR-XXII TaxID=2726739 RepID=UPI001FEF8C16|nr:DUF3391 domain-containing protein [Rhizobium sp. P40RR-XXII]
MKKRIRLHQISAGMFVQELELAENEPSGMAGGFYISSPADVDRLMRSQRLASSLVATSVPTLSRAIAGMWNDMMRT